MPTYPMDLPIGTFIEVWYTSEGKFEEFRGGCHSPWSYFQQMVTNSIIFTHTLQKVPLEEDSCVPLDHSYLVKAVGENSVSFLEGMSWLMDETCGITSTYFMFTMHCLTCPLGVGQEISTCLCFPKRNKQISRRILLFYCKEMELELVTLFKDYLSPLLFMVGFGDFSP